MPRKCRDDGGFALLALLMVIGIGSASILIAVQAMVPPQAEVTARLQHGLSTIEHATREAFQRDGAFPTDLAALAGASGLSGNGAWRTDPWGEGRDFDYQLLASGPRITSRGADRTLGTSDDVAITVVAEDQLRLRTNARLRLIRAIYLKALYEEMAAADDDAGNGNSGRDGPGQGDEHRSDAGNEHANGSGTGGGNSGGGNNGNGNSNVVIARDDLRAALRNYAIAKRQWLSADTATRSTLTTQMNAAAATITAAQAAADWTMPAAMTGAGGLMERLGLPDGRAVDGRGHPFALHDTLAVLATGNDGQTTTDDDS